MGGERAGHETYIIFYDVCIMESGATVRSMLFREDTELATISSSSFPAFTNQVTNLYKWLNISGPTDMLWKSRSAVTILSSIYYSAVILGWHSVGRGL